MEREAIEGLPGGANRSLNQIPLQTRGVVQDSLGDIHIHGEHRNLQYRLSGVQLPEGVAGFAQVFDARPLRSDRGIDNPEAGFVGAAGGG